MQAPSAMLHYHCTLDVICKREPWRDGVNSGRSTISSDVRLFSALPNQRRDGGSGLLLLLCLFAILSRRFAISIRRRVRGGFTRRKCTDGDSESCCWGPFHTGTSWVWVASSGNPLRVRARCLLLTGCCVVYVRCHRSTIKLNYGTLWYFVLYGFSLA